MGKLIVPCIYDWLNIFSEGLAKVELNGKCGFIDKSGKLIVPCIYEAGSFSEGMVKYNLMEVWFYNKIGEIIISFIYENDYSSGAYEFSGGLAKAVRNGKVGLY